MHAAPAFETTMPPEPLESDEPQLPLRVRRAGLLLGPACALAVGFAPLPLETPAHRLAAVATGAIVFWITEALPLAVTALLIAPVMVAAGICSPAAAFAPYADPLLFVFVGGFMLARAMSRHGLDRRIALGLVGSRLVAGHPARARLLLVLAALMVSAWVSNTATAAMLLPILLGLYGGRPLPSGAVTGSALAVAYAASLGGLLTPIGSPPNLIAMRMLAEAGAPVRFVEWSAVSLPVVLLGAAMMVLLLQMRHPPGTERLGATDRPDRRWSRGERAAGIALLVAIAGWVLPDVVPGARAWIGNRLEAGAVALFATLIVFVVRDERGAPVLPWSEAVRIDWGIVLLFGGGLSLGKQMFETGLAATMARSMLAVTGVASLAGLVVVLVVVTLLLTEVCSNTATANMLAPIAIAMARELGTCPVPAVLGVGLAASCAFMLPIATGPNAVVFATRAVGIGAMARAGAWLNVVCAALIVAVLLVTHGLVCGH